MTLDVYRGRKTTMQQQQQLRKAVQLTDPNTQKAVHHNNKQYIQQTLHNSPLFFQCDNEHFYKISASIMYHTSDIIVFLLFTMKPIVLVQVCHVFI